MPEWSPDPALPPPDFAIVGAPKCGTTALYSYLATHPGIAMSRFKEPGFWSRDIGYLWRLTDRAAYDAMWADAPPGALRGEATPSLIQSQVAIPELLASRPDVRLIAMIRNPVELVASRHANLIADYLEDADLETAWRLQERRRRGEALPPRCPEPEQFQYRAYAAIGDQLERFLAVVPAGQRIVIVHDDFRADTRGQYLRALALLGLADDGRRDFAPVFASRSVLWRGLSDFQRWLGRRTALLYRPARAIAHRLGLSPDALLHKANVRTAPRKPLRPDFERELIADFCRRSRRSSACSAAILPRGRRRGAR